MARTPLRAQALDAPGPIRPDPRLTPGATVVVGRDALCTPGYAREVRYVPSDVHRAVFREYGLVGAGVRTRDYEVDHLVPLSLGGANDITNLWPQSRRTEPWNAAAKDALEARLHELVCFGASTCARRRRRSAATGSPPTSATSGRCRRRGRARTGGGGERAWPACSRCATTSASVRAAFGPSRAAP